VLNALRPKRKSPPKGEIVKTLIDSFRYPRKGPGMMWDSCSQRIRDMGGRILLGTTVVGCQFNTRTSRWTIRYEDGSQQTHLLDVDHVISSAPIRELVHGIEPRMSNETRLAASSLRYRDFLTVVLILKDRDAVSDNWIYIHDPGVRVGRVQNFKSWSPEMVPDPTMACYGLEYFCFENDDLWCAPDAELIDLGRRELASIGLAKAEDVVDGCVVRQRKAYPVYDDDYARHVATIRQEIGRAYPNLHLVGRNGMHKYNNQDHAMMTAMLCVRNILAGAPLYDVWRVNQDAEYHEAGDSGQHSGASGLRAVPARTL
jgi:protoporphyrinogen oxidase